MNKATNTVRGFTLIELLIVVAIIAILAAIAIPNFLQAQVRAKVSRVQSEQKTTATALESYMVDNNVYPWYNNPHDDAAEGEFYTPITLTTPVSYISSLFNDVFPNMNSSKDTHDAHPFHYKHEEQNPGVVGAIYETCYDLPAGSGNNFKWLVSSHGPDVDDDEMEVLYDPTNGVTSSGDIVRFGP
jgi:prepilin-type N-terminal cleavage/methylation domain-containing protein